jgi:hypothetical protein
VAPTAANACLLSPQAGQRLPDPLRADSSACSFYQSMLNGGVLPKTWCLPLFLIGTLKILPPCIFKCDEHQTPADRLPRLSAKTLRQNAHTNLCLKKIIYFR